MYFNKIIMKHNIYYIIVLSYLCIRNNVVYIFILSGPQYMAYSCIYNYKLSIGLYDIYDMYVAQLAKRRTHKQ